MYAKLVLNLERALIPATQCAEGSAAAARVSPLSVCGHLITQDVMIHCQKARYYAKDATLRRGGGHKDFCLQFFFNSLTNTCKLQRRVIHS